MKQRVFGMVLAAALVLSLLPAAALAAPLPDVWDGSIEKPTKLVQVDGVYYYEITKCAELAYVAQTGGEWLSRNYILANDLILNDVTLTWDVKGNLLNDPEALYQWTPIGGYRGQAFTGIFDGGNHTISGLYIEINIQLTDIRYPGFFGNAETIRNVHIENAYITSQQHYIGGVAAGADHIENCSFHGFVRGVISSTHVGGIVGYGNAIHCTNYGEVHGSGETPSNSATGGVVGYGSAENCVNQGIVYGGPNLERPCGAVNLGGIIGRGEAKSCVNLGPVTGRINTGGIIGDGPAENSYNAASVSGEAFVGGIAGKASEITDCFSIGPVLCDTTTSAGAIVGSDDVLFGKAAVKGCYYLKSDTVNAVLFGCGNVGNSGLSDPAGLSAKSSSALKQQATYDGWDFETIWSIAPSFNGGYPYLSWQDTTAAPLIGLTLGASSLSLSVGDVAYLTVSPAPVTAALPSLTWSSDNKSAATVNEYGRITAVGPGSAKITVSGGSFSASCDITVKVRMSNEYKLGVLTVRDTSGQPLSAIPSGSFLVTVPVTKQEAGGDALILLAAYTANGQYRGLMYVSVEDVPAGATVKVTLPVENANKDIAQLKAFAVAGFGSFTPISPASVFPEA